MVPHTNRAAGGQARYARKRSISDPPPVAQSTLLCSRSQHFTWDPGTRVEGGQCEAARYHV